FLKVTIANKVSIKSFARAGRRNSFRFSARNQLRRRNAWKSRAGAEMPVGEESAEHYYRRKNKEQGGLCMNDRAEQVSGGVRGLDLSQIFAKNIEGGGGG